MTRRFDLPDIISDALFHFDMRFLFLDLPLADPFRSRQLGVVVTALMIMMRSV